MGTRDGWWTTIVGSLVVSAICAGAWGLILSQVTAAEVEQLKDRQGRIEIQTQESSQKISTIAAQTNATKESVDRIEDKLDRLIERQTDRRPR